MNDSIRLAGVCCIVAVLIGCGPSATNMSNRNHIGAFNNIRMEVRDMHAYVNSGKWDPRLSPVEDQLGAAVSAYMRNKEIKGTPLEAEGQKLLDLEAKIMQIWQSPEGSIEKVQAAVQEMMDQVERMEEM